MFANFFLQVHDPIQQRAATQFRGEHAKIGVLKGVGTSVR